MAKVTDPAVLALLNGGVAAPAKPAGAPSLVPAATAPATAAPAATPYGGDAAGLLREFEGFRETPYWDVNAYRTGYGSDTVTRADGSVVPVTQGMSINREDAERDLARRTREFENTATGQIGADVWGSLPANARAALTSVTYNYGSLPNSVVSAAKSGDVNAIADAVYGLRGHNKGINAQRREREAAIIRGEAYTPSSAAADAGNVVATPFPANGAGQRVTDPSVLSLLNSDTPAADAASEESPISLPPIAAPISVDPAAVPAEAPVDPAIAANLAAQEQLRSELPVPGTIENPTVPNAWEQVTGALKNDVRDMGNMVEDAGRNALSAIEGPGRALQGDPAFQPTIDMTTGEVVSQPPAMIEAATNAAGLTLGNGPGMAARGMLSADPRVAAQAAALARTAAADEFAIPLTRGQATQTLTQQVNEELLRQGTTNASKAIQNFDTAQTAAVGDAVNAMGQRVGTGAADVGPTVMNALNKIVSDTKTKANELFDRAFGSNLKIRTSALGDLPGAVAQRLYDDGVLVDTQPGGVTPVASFALQQIDQAKSILAGVSPTSLPGDGANITAVNLRSIEQIRKRLVQLEGSTPEDRRAVAAVKRGFDDWLDNTVDRMLITGDDEALEALKEARAAWSDYKNLSTAKPGQAAQQAVVKMQKQDATAEEVANWLYGADIASPSLAAPKVAERIKGIVGDDSDAWSAVRASAFERLVTNPNTGDPRTPLMISNRIDQFLNNKGETLSRVLFSDEEISELKRFSDVLKTTVTPRNAANPSRSGSTLINAARKLSGQLAGVFGAMAGGPAAGVAAALAYPVFQAAKEGGRAANALKRIEPIAPVAAPPYSNSNVLTRFGITAPAEPAQDVVPENSNVLYQLAT